MADSGRVVIEVLSADDSPFILTHSINLLVEASPSPSSFSPLLLWSRRSYRAIKIDTMAKSRIIIINDVCRPELRAELRTPRKRHFRDVGGGGVVHAYGRPGGGLFFYFLGG